MIVKFNTVYRHLQIYKSLGFRNPVHMLYYTNTGRLFSISLPANKYVCDRSPFDRPIATEGKPRLTMDILGISCIGAIVTLIDRYIYPSTFWMILKQIVANILSKQ